MRKFFYKMKNIPWVNVLIIALVSVLCIGSIVAIGSYVKNDKTTLSSLEFKRGALNDRGFYIESDQSIYTKDLIECQGLEIEPDFETIGTYQVYYYDSNKQFIGKTDKINSQTDGVYVKGDNFHFAKYCRIVITPEVKDDDGNVDVDYAIKFYEVAGIANKFKISVNKEQKAFAGVSIYDVYATNKAFFDTRLNTVGEEFVGPQDYEGYDIAHIDVKGMEKVIFNQHVCESLTYIVVDAENVVLYKGSYTADKKVEIELPENAADIYISINQIPGNYLIYAE